jgi:hypothetical protein
MLGAILKAASYAFAADFSSPSSSSTRPSLSRAGVPRRFAARVFRIVLRCSPHWIGLTSSVRTRIVFAEPSRRTYFLRRPRISRTAPAIRASADIPDDGSISGTAAHKALGAPITSNATTASTGNTAFPNLRIGISSILSELISCVVLESAEQHQQAVPMQPHRLWDRWRRQCALSLFRASTYCG